MILEAQGLNFRCYIPPLCPYNMINNDEPYLVVFVGFCKMETDNKWKTATYRAVAMSFYRIADEFSGISYKALPLLLGNRNQIIH